MLEYINEIPPRVLVTGGRAYESIDVVFQTLDKIHQETPIETIIEGGATGADTLARRWAASRGVKNDTYIAEWKAQGKAAGMIRNRRMLEHARPTLVVAFPGGKGTAHMVEAARKAGVEVREVT